VITENSIETVREFIKNQPKSSLKFMEIELNISKTSIYRILTEHLGLQKVCARFVPHKLTDVQKLLRIQHSKDIIEEAKKDPNFPRLWLVTKRGVFNMIPKRNARVLNGRRRTSRNPKNRAWRSQKWLICFYDSKGIVHKEFVPPGQNVNAVFYLGVRLKRLVRRIRRVWPEYREDGSWRLLHDNAPSHRSTLVSDYLTKNHILTINHSPYSPDMAPCDFYLFGEMHLSMKGKRYEDVEAIQKAWTGILAAIPGNELKHSFDMLLDHAKRCIKAEGDYFEGDYFWKNYLLCLFLKVLLTLELTLYICIWNTANCHNVPRRVATCRILSSWTLCYYKKIQLLYLVYYKLLILLIYTRIITTPIRAKHPTLITVR